MNKEVGIILLNVVMMGCFVSGWKLSEYNEHKKFKNKNERCVSEMGDIRSRSDNEVKQTD